MKFSNGSEIKTEKELRNIKGGLWTRESTPTRYADIGYYPLEYQTLLDYEEHDESVLTLDVDKYIVGKKDISFEDAIAKCIQEIDSLRTIYSNRGIEWTYNSEIYTLSTSQNARINTKAVMDDVKNNKETKNRKWITKTGKPVQIAKQDVEQMYDAIKTHIEVAFEMQAFHNEAVYTSTTVSELRTIINLARGDFE
jgi:hypothetical protein